MNTLKRTLALIVVASVTGCGGGGSGSQTPVTPVVKATSNAVTRTPDAKAVITLKFPAHVAKAHAAVTSSKQRKPAYINPDSGNSLVFTYQGQTIDDPSTGYGYFSLGTQDPTTGTSTLTVPLMSGFYDDGALTVTEYDTANGTGDVLAYGYNAAYTDSGGNYNSGTFTINPGDTVSPIITMTMNIAAIAMTTDPVHGAGAVLLTSNSSPPSHLCAYTGNVLYVFPADASGTFVVPGATPGAGYLGADPNNNIPGVPPVQINPQQPYGSPGATLNLSILGAGYVLNAPDPYSYDSVSFYVYTLLGNLNPAPPFSYNYTTTGYLNVGPDYC
jgi:hypothetical protein